MCSRDSQAKARKINEKKRGRYVGLGALPRLWRHKFV